MGGKDDIWKGKNHLSSCKVNRNCTTRLQRDISRPCSKSRTQCFATTLSTISPFPIVDCHSVTLNPDHRSTANYENSLSIDHSLLHAMAEPRSTRHQAASSTISWNTDDAYEYIVLVLGHRDGIPQRYDYTLGTEEMLRRLRARYGAEHGMRCVGLLRWCVYFGDDLP